MMARVRDIKRKLDCSLSRSPSRHENPGHDEPEADGPDETNEPVTKRPKCSRSSSEFLDDQQKTQEVETTGGIEMDFRRRWPKKYAPANPACPVIGSRMNRMLKRWNALGKQPDELWDEQGDGGLMIAAIRQSRSKRITQRIFNVIDPWLSAIEEGSNTGRPKISTTRKSKCAPAEHQQKTEPVENEPEKSTPKAAKSQIHPPTRLPRPQTSSDAQDGYSDNDPASADDVFSSPKLELGSPLNRAIIEISSDSSDSSVKDKPSSTIRETIRRLRNNEMLESVDIQRCEQLLGPPRDWHVFEPGFPTLKNPQALRKQKKHRHLVFFPNAHGHWSLCHVDTVEAVLHHYNSLKGIVMPTEVVKNWVEKQSVIRLERAIEIVDEECPQQEGGVNCGVFALAVLKSLFTGKAVPETVDASSLRHFFARKAEAAISGEEENDVDAASAADPTASDGQNTDPTTNVSVASESPSDPIGRPSAGEEVSIWPPVGSPNADRSSLGLQLPSLAEVSTQATMTYLESFMKGLKALQASIKGWKEQAAAQRRSLTTMEQNLSAHREQLEQQERRVKELESQVMSPELVADFAKNVRQSIGDQYGSQTSHPFLQKWCKGLTSTLDQMTAESAALIAQKQDAQAACERHQGEMQRLEDAIIQGEARQKELEDDIRTNNNTLAKMRQSCAEVANGDESTSEKESVEE